MKANQIRVDDRGTIYVRVQTRDTLAVALEASGLPSPGPVLVVIGGARQAGRGAQAPDPSVHRRARAIEREGAVAVDGGTDAGVMRLLGDAREASSATFPLLGVAAEGTVHLPGTASPQTDAANLEPHHTHFVLVPGDQWGDESWWITATASHLAGAARPSPSWSMGVTLRTETLQCRGRTPAPRDPRFGPRR